MPGTQVTYDQFNALVLAALGVPVTRNNLDKLNAIAVQEGKHGNFNPMNWVRPDTGSSPYNSVGVQNYADLTSGVRQTALGLQQGNTSALLENLKRDGPYADFLKATSAFYSTWGGGNIIISQGQATKAGDTLLEGQTTMDELNLVKNQVAADLGGVGEWIPGVHMDTLGTTDPNLGTGPLGPKISDVTSLPDPMAFLNALWTALGDKNTWIRVAMFGGGFILLIMGFWMLADRMSPGAVPTPGEVAGAAGKAAVA